jgi:uncharacterized protein YjiK
MNHKFSLNAIAFLFLSQIVGAQNITSVTYRGMVVIPNGYKVAGSVVGGLSGIAFDNKDSSFYLAADKPPSRLYQVNISTASDPKVSWEKVLELTPALIGKSELEGIALNHENGKIYVSDEQKDGTRILELDSSARFTRIVEPVDQAFLPLSGHNSGIEGLTVNEDLDYLFYAFERPTNDCLKQSLVVITKKSLADLSVVNNFYYKLHAVENDILGTNGISEIISITNKKLLVMERAYIPNQGNVVRLFEADLRDTGMAGKISDCNDGAVNSLASKLLFDFVDVAQIEIDNAEGMTFNDDRSKLYIVTDNNFSSKQKTQIIVLDVEWK